MLGCTPILYKLFFWAFLMDFPINQSDKFRANLSNRIFFRLYQCANMLHKTGSRALEGDGLTTQQWAVLGALSRPEVPDGMAMGDLARYLMVSRQNLSGLIGRMERDGHVHLVPDGRDRRSRRVQMTEAGWKAWSVDALPKISAYYDQVLEGFSSNDMLHTVHYLLRLLENMEKVDVAQGQAGETGAETDDAVA